MIDTFEELGQNRFDRSVAHAAVILISVVLNIFG
jgi:hypothetical protein